MDRPRIIEHLDVDTVARRLRSDSPEPLIVDVREPDEYIGERVPGAVLQPMSTFADRFRELPADRPLFMLCQTGRRSAVAADHLLRNGYGTVANVMGGIVAWRAAGLPVKGGRIEPGEGGVPGTTEGGGGSTAA